MWSTAWPEFTRVVRSGRLSCWLLVELGPISADSTFRRCRKLLTNGRDGLFFIFLAKSLDLLLENKDVFLGYYWPDWVLIHLPTARSLASNRNGLFHLLRRIVLSCDWKMLKMSSSVFFFKDYRSGFVNSCLIRLFSAWMNPGVTEMHWFIRSFLKKFIGFVIYYRLYCNFSLFLLVQQKLPSFWLFKFSLSTFCFKFSFENIQFSTGLQFLLAKKNHFLGFQRMRLSKFCIYRNFWSLSCQLFWTSKKRKLMKEVNCGELPLNLRLLSKVFFWALKYNRNS